MKHFYFLTSVLFLFSQTIRSQTSVIEISPNSNTTTPLSNNSVLYVSVAKYKSIESDFQVKNVSNATQTLSIKKIENSLNTVSASDAAEAFFCTDANCYLSTVYSASVVLTAGQSFVHKAELTEASIAGPSSVSYKISDFNNHADALTFTLKYNDAAAVSVKDNGSVSSTISNIYPNPSSSTAYMNINCLHETDITMRVLNTLGSIVITKQLNLNSGKNVVTIDSEKFSAGIYFVSIAEGSLVTTKKITITK